MKVFVYSVVIAIYLAALVYVLLGALGFSLGVRIAGNTFADEGLGFQRTIYLILLGVLLCFGLYLVWRVGRHSA